MISRFILITIWTSTSFYCSGCSFPKKHFHNKFQAFEKVEMPGNNQITISNEAMAVGLKNEWMNDVN